MKFESTLALINTDGFEVTNNNNELLQATIDELGLATMTADQAQDLRNQFVIKFTETFTDRDERIDNMTKLSYVTAVIDQHIFRNGGIV